MSGSRIVFLSLNNFAQVIWNQYNGPFAGEIIAIAPYNNKLYCASEHTGAFESVDHGASWTPTLPTIGNIFSMMNDGTNLYVGTDKLYSYNGTNISEIASANASFRAWSGFPNFKNNYCVVGEVKSFDKGVLTIETVYSKSDFSIEWSGIQKICTKQSLWHTLTDGNRITGTLSSPSSQRVSIVDNNGVAHDHAIDEIVSMKKNGPSMPPMYFILMRRI